MSKAGWKAGDKKTIEEMLEEGVPSVDTEQLSTSSIPISYVVWKDKNGVIYADPKNLDTESFEGTDASTVIQNAIDNLQNVGINPPDSRGAIFIRRGEYDITTQLELAQRMMLVGEGRGSRLANNVGTGNACVAISGSSGDEHYDTTIRDIDITGVGNAGDQGILVNFGINIRIENVYAINSVDASIKLDHASFSHIINSSIEESTAFGLYIVSGKEIMIVNNGIKSNATQGIRISSPESGIISNNLITNNGNTGLLAISWGSGKNLQVVNNLVYNNLTDGIRFDGITDGIIQGNRCYNDGSGETQETGIKEVSDAATSDYNLIHGNNVRGNNTAGISTVGVNTVVTDNLP